MRFFPFVLVTSVVGDDLVNDDMQLLQSRKDKQSQEACMQVLTGEEAPIEGTFIGVNNHKVDVSVGDVAPTPGTFCVPSTSLALLERSFGLSSAGDIEAAVTSKRRKTTTTSTTSTNYEAGPGMVIEGYTELYDDGKSGACRYMEAGELSKGSCGDDFLVPQKDGSTTCLVGKYSAQTAEVIAALQTASSPQTCAELCDKTEGCGAFEMSGGTLEATKCEMWTSTPTFSQHSTSRPHWCYAKLNYEASPGMAVAGYSELRDDEGQSGACRYMDAEELSKGTCGSDFTVPQKDGNTTCLVGKYDEQTAEVIDALQTAGNPKACGDLCDRTENCVAFEMSGGTLASTKCELWSATPTLNQFSSSRPHWCYVKSS